MLTSLHRAFESPRSATQHFAFAFVYTDSYTMGKGGQLLPAKWAPKDEGTKMTYNKRDALDYFTMLGL